jgi:small subunit ribosomal protein S21
MLEVKKEGKESVDSLLKKMKKKWRDTKLVKNLRDRKEHTKDSVKNRKSKQKAKYVQKKFGDGDGNE